MDDDDSLLADATQLETHHNKDGFHEMKDNNSNDDVMFTNESYENIEDDSKDGELVILTTMTENEENEFRMCTEWTVREKSGKIASAPARMSAPKAAEQAVNQAALEISDDDRNSQNEQSQSPGIEISSRPYIIENQNMQGDHQIEDIDDKVEEVDSDAESELEVIVERDQYDELMDAPDKDINGYCDDDQNDQDDGIGQYDFDDDDKGGGMKQKKGYPEKNAVVIGKQKVGKSKVMLYGIHLDDKGRVTRKSNACSSCKTIMICIKCNTKCNECKMTVKCKCDIKSISCPKCKPAAFKSSENKVCSKCQVKTMSNPKGPHVEKKHAMTEHDIEKAYQDGVIDAANKKFIRNCLKNPKLSQEYQIKFDDLELKIANHVTGKTYLFKPVKSKQAEAAMKNKKCGYDFLDNLNDGSDFLTRLFNAQHGSGGAKAKKGLLEALEKDYEYSHDKLQCPKCKKEQSFDEFQKKKRTCSQCSTAENPCKFQKLKITTGEKFNANNAERERLRQEKRDKLEMEMYGNLGKPQKHSRDNSASFTGSREPLSKGGLSGSTGALLLDKLTPNPPPPSKSSNQTDKRPQSTGYIQRNQNYNLTEATPPEPISKNISSRPLSATATTAVKSSSNRPLSATATVKISSTARNSGSNNALKTSKYSKPTEEDMDPEDIIQKIRSNTAPPRNPQHIMDKINANRQTAIDKTAEEIEKHPHHENILDQVTKKLPDKKTSSEGLIRIKKASRTNEDTNNFLETPTSSQGTRKKTDRSNRVGTKHWTHKKQTEIDPKFAALVDT